MSGGGDIGGESKQKGKHAKKKKVKRVAIRIDMTPLVDVAFLLLTFFMLTTVFNKPQTMELNLPPDQETKIEVAESNLLTIKVLEDGNIWWSKGSAAPTMITFSGLRPLLLEQNRSNPKLITLVKVDREGKYTQMVDVMDELNLANVTRFSLAPLTDKDKDQIRKLQG
ncbi:MAG: biopolymer transporter ExbD [Bacteroidetes bacterium]|jgi:biopolymer transport protein ExbD|nr:biopolymer transporter ExbD [Bacteroidota bacterium]